VQANHALTFWMSLGGKSSKDPQRKGASTRLAMKVSGQLFSEEKKGLSITDVSLTSFLAQPVGGKNFGRKRASATTCKFARGDAS